MLRAALTYPLRGDDRVFTLAMGGGLHLLAVYLPLLPLVPVVGYLVATLRHVAGDADAEGGGGGPPSAALEAGAPPLVTDADDGALDALRRLGRDGLGGTVVVAAYLLPPTLALWLGARFLLGTGGNAGGTAVAGGGGAGAAGTAVLLLGGTLVVFVALLLLYPLPAGLVAFARTGRLRAAFDRERVGRTLAGGRYFVGWVGGVAVVVAASALATPLNRVALGFFVVFYAEVAAAAAWAVGSTR